MLAIARFRFFWAALAAMIVCAGVTARLVGDEEEAVREVLKAAKELESTEGTTTNDKSLTEKTLNDKTTTSTAPAPQKLQGNGRQASNKFKLEKGLTFFRTAHNGTSNYIVYLVNNEGEQVQNLYNNIGAFEGTRGFEIKESGEYLLDIQADGKWAFEIEQPRPTTGDATPKSITGKETNVSPFLALKKGLSVFKFNYKGDGRFSVTLVDANGRPIEHIVNRLKAFDGSAPVKVPQDGVYFLNVNADGNWQIDVQ